MQLMKDIGIPNGIAGVGYGKDDVDDLVDGTMKQARILAVAPKPVQEEDIARIFTGSLENW
jgi:alcohol dehydrogenase class IV